MLKIIEKLTKCLKIKTLKITRNFLNFFVSILSKFNLVHNPFELHFWIEHKFFCDGLSCPSAFNSTTAGLVVKLFSPSAAEILVLVCYTTTFFLYHYIFLYHDIFFRVQNMVYIPKNFFDPYLQIGTSNKFFSHSTHPHSNHFTYKYQKFSYFFFTYMVHKPHTSVS